MVRIAGYVAAALLLAGTAVAEEPQRGGTLVFGLAAEPPTYDCHQANTYVVLDTLSPVYSLLARFDPVRKGEYEPDLAKSWEIAGDGLTYTFHLHPNVRFHDGTPLTAADVKASFDRIRLAPAGIISQRKGSFDAIREIETPDPVTVVFRLKEVDAGLMSNIAAPWSCIYSAKRLEQDPRFPEKNIMGSGPFIFVEHKPGAYFTGRRNPDYFLEGRPYLDGYRAEFISGAAMVNSLSGGSVMAEFRGVTPPERDRIVAARGDKMKILTSSDWVILFQVTLNVRRKPFDDPRVRRALTLAIDRWGNAEPISRVTFLGPIAGFSPPGSYWELPREELEKAPGFGHDIKAAREEAKRLLKEAGVADLKFRLLNRTQLQPYTQFGVFLIDQWRQIGVTVEHDILETSPWQNARNRGTYDVMVEAMAEHSDDPSTLYAHFISSDRAPINYSGAIDRVADDLFDEQQRSLDKEERRRHVQALDKHLLGEAYFAPVFWSNRIIPIAAEVRGWHMTPSHFLGQDLRDVWLAK
jgi:peptide/nickel transport system substrate-binding protein